MSDSIAVFYCFPRSGGTLLNQCLLCAPGTVVLSEINPSSSVIPIEQQAAEWFQLLNPTEAADLANRTYLEKISRVYDRTNAAQKSLCVRDWCGINFLAHISPWLGVPSQVLEQRLYLQHGGYELREIALVRRSAAVYRSLHENIPELAALTVEEFGAAYRSYLRQLSSVKKYQLEHLTSASSAVLKSICADLKMPFPSGFETRFHTITTVTGNNTLPTPPASARWTAIQGTSKTGNQQPSAEHLEIFEGLDQLAGYGPLTSQ